MIDAMLAASPVTVFSLRNSSPTATFATRLPGLETETTDRNQHLCAAAAELLEGGALASCEDQRRGPPTAIHHCARCHAAANWETSSR